MKDNSMKESAYRAHDGLARDYNTDEKANGARILTLMEFAIVHTH